MKNIVVVGATSAIAERVCRIYAKQGCRFFLLARNQERLDSLTSDLRVRGAKHVESQSFDITDIESHQAIVEDVFAKAIPVDLILIAHGTLPNQNACESNVDTMLRELNTNAIGTLALLTRFAAKLEDQRTGTIAVITSVAGDRGRQSNYVYGSAKAMVSTFLQGLRNRLYKAGVNVLDIKPGFVDTPMTAGFDKGLLWASPESVALTIVRAIENRAAVVYAPRFWFLIMTTIKAIPETVFKRMKL